jgi:FAD:protein FMN transferase
MLTTEFTEIMTHNLCQKFSFWAMGAENTVLVYGGPSEIDGKSTEQWIREEVEAYEQAWSRFRPHSELNRFIMSSGPQYELSDELLLALDCAQLLWVATDGLFDSRVCSDLNALGYSKPFRNLAVNDRGVRCGHRASSTLHSTCYDAVRTGGRFSAATPGFEVDLDRHVASCAFGVELDFGGLGKGLAADLIAASLMKLGAVGACVSMGGDVRTIGVGPDDGGWSIPIWNPFRPEQFFTHHRCVDTSVVASTTGFRRWMGDDMHHDLIDPRTGLPSVGGVHSVAASGSQAWWAEGAAKAALIAGRDGAIDVLERLGLDGWVFLDTGEVRTTSSLMDGHNREPRSTDVRVEASASRMPITKFGD